MHIVAIAWLYVTLLMALTATSLMKGVLWFLTFGLMPVLAVLWMAGKLRRRTPSRASGGNTSEQGADSGS